MRKIIVCFLVITLSCSSNDDEVAIDVELLYGEWNQRDLCAPQNNLLLNVNGTYVRLFSGNSCGSNNNDTYQYTGTFNINGDNISFNQQTETIIEDGDATPNSVEDLSELVSQKITVLTETELVIEREFNIDPIFRNWNFIKQ